jgi:hypothetical protein
MTTRSRRSPRLAALLIATVLGSLAGLLAYAPGGAATQAQAQVPQPVMNGPVFNDPADGPASGTPTAAQRAVFDQLIGLIDATPGGETISLAMFEFVDGASGVPQQVVTSLLDAHERGARVRVILNTSSKNEPVRQRLDAALGHDDTAASWVVGCGSERGCIGRNYSHEKIALFSRVELPDGAAYEDVVWQSSSNLTDWYLFNSYNDAYTFSDAAVYAGYLTHFNDLNRGRKTSVDPDYFWTTPTGSALRGHFYPRAQGTGDPIVNILRGVECRYTDEAGTARKTDIRLVISAFTQHRAQIAEELLRLRGENCWIDVVYAASGIESGPLGVLRETASNGKTIQLTPCTHEVAAGHEVRPHAKVMMLDGFYDDDIDPRVYTGSANFTHLENSDDSQLRVTGRANHDRYLSWFYDLRSACQA